MTSKTAQREGAGCNEHDSIEKNKLYWGAYANNIK